MYHPVSAACHCLNIMKTRNAYHLTATIVRGVYCRCRSADLNSRPHGNSSQLKQMAGLQIRAYCPMSSKRRNFINESHVSKKRALSVKSSARDELLKDVAPEHKTEVSRILELAERALGTWENQHSSFYPPPVVYDGMMVLKRLADVKAVAWGGYTQAERCRISIGREETMVPDLDDADEKEYDTVAAVKVTGNFLFDPAKHPDFLGACLGTGIERSVIGDILVQGDVGAQILCSPSIVEHLESSLTQVRTVPVVTERITMKELRVPEARMKEIQSTESSLRIDAIASAGFRISRGKMADLIKSGDVRLNWKACTKPSATLSEGDMVSCAGKGRLEVGPVSETKKGKHVVSLRRYI